MTNITKKTLNFILSFICLVSFSACQTTTKNAEKLPMIMEIAVLLPMSGPNSATGHQYNELIKMGLEDGSKTHINVTTYDGSDEAHALEAMDKIIKRGTKIILGPLYSPITSQIATKAKNHGIIVITMSNNPALADSKLFVFGHAPLKQLALIINYFLNNDYKNFIALLPAGEHSVQSNKIIQDMVIKGNATLVRSEFYLNLPESINKSVKLVSDSVDNLNEIEDSMTKPVIYLSDDPKNLNLIFNSIHKYNLDKKAIIAGDNRIDIEYPENIDIIFSGSLNFLNSDISDRAKKFGINHMSFMHLIAYDLGRMTASFIGDEPDLEQFLARINSKVPYIGVSGNIRFIDSIAQREYDIIKRENGEYTTISPSPRSKLLPQ